VLEAVLGLAGQDARQCDLPQPTRGDPAQGALDGCGCSALEAALWCNAEQAPRWSAAELLLARGASPKLSGLLPRAAPPVESADLAVPPPTAPPTPTPQGPTPGAWLRRALSRDAPPRRSGPPCEAPPHRTAHHPMRGRGAAVRPGPQSPIPRP
jgi:hypothetical protein